jgi:RNA polymerase sigma factor (sigma-70 family)
MQPSPRGSALGTLRRLAGAGGAGDRSDADLLERFRGRHEEAAFTLLVQRHGPMVLAVCRRVLGDRHEAEDAFQATFLVLVRKASAIRKQASLASWLYGVAYRVAVKARARAITRRVHERKAGAAMPAPAPPDALANAELRAALDEEMRRLPDKYRIPLVLCGLEGKTHEQAAQALHWPKSSVTARLTRAHDLLQRRLVGRGFAVTAGVLAALVAEQTAAAVPAVLTLATVRLALDTLTDAAAATAPAVALADQVHKGMAMTRRTAALAALLTVGLAGAGLAFLTPRPAVPGAPGGAEAPGPGPAANRPADALPEGALARLGSGRLRHGAAVTDLAFAPDGGRLVSAGAGRLRVWNAATGRLEHRFGVGGEFSVAVAFSADGTLLTSDAVPNADRCRVLDVARGAALRRVVLRANALAPTVMALSAGARRVAVAGQNDVWLFDPASGKETLHLDATGLIGPLHVALSPDSKAVAVSDDSSPVIRVHDAGTGRQTVEVKGQWLGSVAHLTFSPDRRSLAGITPGGPGEAAAVVVWDVGTGQERYRRPGEAWSGACAFSPDGTRLAASGSANDLTLWDAADGKEVRRFRPGASVTAAAFTPDGKVLAAATFHGALVLWDVESGKRLPQSAESVDAVVQLHFTGGGQQLVGLGWDLVAWDPATGREVRRLPNAGLAFGALSPGGTFVAAPGANPIGNVQIADARTGKSLRAVGPESFHHPRAMCFTPDERRLIAEYGQDYKAIVVLDVASGKILHQLTGLQGPVDSLAVSPDGRWLASCSYNPRPGEGDDAVRLWDLHTGRQVKRLPHEFYAIYDLAFAPDGSRLSAGGAQEHGSAPGGVQVWEVPTGKRLLTMNARTPSVKRLAFSPDGRMLAAGGHDASLRLWEVATGEERLRFRGHEGTIDALAFAPDGRSLAAASADAPVFVWDVAGASRPRQPLSAEDLRRCWDDLASDAAAGFRAVRRLAADPEHALPFLRGRLVPVPTADPGRLRQLFAALDSDEFARRKEAAAELEQLGDRAADTLRREARQTSSAEVRRALGKILEDLGGPVTRERRRAVRAVEAAEAMGTPEAARWLAELAGGAPEAHLTREAAAARDRLRAPPP